MALVGSGGSLQQRYFCASLLSERAVSPACLQVLSSLVDVTTSHAAGQCLSPYSVGSLASLSRIQGLNLGRRRSELGKSRCLVHIDVKENSRQHADFQSYGIGSKVYMLEVWQRHLTDANPKRPGSLQKVNSTVGVHTVPKPIWIFPSGGPARDFVFAVIGAICAFIFAAVFAKLWGMEEQQSKATALERGSAMMPELGPNIGQKESVEWVNMLINKIWKVYRRSLETWLMQLLQPAIDKLGKPDYVRRVEIAELNLDYEPISVRKVRRRASRRANDLQYQFGVRYTGGARCLLSLKLGKAGLVSSVPVGVYNLDVDAELWVKLRLAPVKPYVGTLSLAFVRLPTIKLILAPFKIVNLFAIPFLSRFLSRLLTVDLPRLLVLPRHITFDFLPTGTDPLASSILDLFKSEAVVGASPQTEPSDAFVGELSITVCEARDLPIRGFTGWSNPYCILALGDQVVESKRNNETSHPAGYKNPVWNQDFQFLVEDHRKQTLLVKVRDSSLTLNPNIGHCLITLADLQDCVPRTHWVSLTRQTAFGPRKVPGKLRLIFTYKSFVEEGNDDLASPYIKVFNNDTMEELVNVGVTPSPRLDIDPVSKTLPFPDLDTDFTASDMSDLSDTDVDISPAKVFVSNEVVGKEISLAPAQKDSSSGMVWLCLLTTVAYVVGCSLHISNPLQP